MRILFFSFFFEPDLSAGSFRNTAIFREMLEHLGEDDFVHVITTMPNRYSSFSAQTQPEERGKNYLIHRIATPAHSSGMVQQVKSYSVFYRKAWNLVRGEKYDLVYASSSRFFTAFLGRRLAARMGCPLYLDIRDIFVDTIKSIFGNRKWMQVPLVMALKPIERYVFTGAKHINLVSEGFKEYFQKFHGPTFSFYTNAIDEIFMTAGRPTPQPVSKPYIITYAGNIGSGQGLEKIIPAAAARLGQDYEFHIIGDGGTRYKLEEEIQRTGVTNVKLLKPMPRKDLIECYNQSTYLFFHLNDLEAFKKVLPSKMFEYGAFDKPVIAGVTGYAAQFVEQHIPNHILFEPTNVEEFVTKLQQTPLRFESREHFKENFSRKMISKRIVESIFSNIQK